MCRLPPYCCPTNRGCCASLSARGMASITITRFPCRLKTSVRRRCRRTDVFRREGKRVIVMLAMPLADKDAQHPLFVGQQYGGSLHIYQPPRLVNNLAHDGLRLKRAD